MAVRKKWVAACPLQCGWTATSFDDTGTETHAHLVEKHPELIEPLPHLRGQLYTHPIWRTFKKV